jgi:hypothetical protein
MAEPPDLPPGGVAWDETLELEASDGIRLRGGLWRAGGANTRGLVLLLSGRTEFSFWRNARYRRHSWWRAASRSPVSTGAGRAARSGWPIRC